MGISADGGHCFNPVDESQMKVVLEKLYVRYNRRRLIEPDPLQFVYRYSSRADMEIVALLSAVLAYGRVRQIEKNLTNLFARMGNNPFDFVLNFDERAGAGLKKFKHRFTTGDNISDLLFLLKTVIDRHGTIEAFFVQGYNSSDKNIIPALSNFCGSLLRIYAETFSRQPDRGLRYLLADPNDRSACKRLNLFLRWMVRDDDVDTGLWKSVDKAKLIVPVDVHIARLCRILKLYNRKTVSLASAVEITESFAKIQPGDPVKYDFALSRIGIVENCNGKYKPHCDNCELIAFCREKH
ncbi:MAG: TIGR02757 family protein [Sedimentisphaerales bacterium]|nr:TIGR02757 family protein [Sedimentisphaerales bacterium]